MCDVVFKKAADLKANPDNVDIISWRYNLRHGQVNNWLAETDWNYDQIQYPLAFEQVVNYLIKLKLLTEQEAENWRLKLFIQ
jgi:hypothetical protein